MKTKTITVPFIERDYCLYGIPYLLSAEQRKFTDDFLKIAKVVSVLSASSPYQGYYKQYSVNLLCKLSCPVKEYLIDTLNANLEDKRAAKILAWLCIPSAMYNNIDPSTNPFPPRA